MAKRPETVITRVDVTMRGVVVFPYATILHVHERHYGPTGKVHTILVYPTQEALAALNNPTVCFVALHPHEVE